MTKISDVESDLAQYKTEVGDRFEKVDAAIESLRVDTAKQHSEVMKQQAEMMKLLLQQTAATRTPPPR